MKAVGLLLFCALGLRLGFGFEPTPAPLAPSPATASAPLVSIRVGVSRRLLQAINETDGRNLLLGNAQTTGKIAGLDVQFASGGFMDGPELARALERGEIDLASMPADEFVRLPRTLVRDEVLTSYTGGKCEEEFLLLVRRDSPFQSLAALANRRLNVQQSTKSHLSVLWLDLLSRQAGLGSAEQAFPATRVSPKSSQVILPVYFRQADAAIATRRSLELLAELNPGIAQDLHAIASSPPILSAVICFRAGVPDAVVTRTVAAIHRLRSTPMGRQALTLFQIDLFDLANPAILAQTRALVAARDELATQTPVTRPNAAGGHPGTDTP